VCLEPFRISKWDSKRSKKFYCDTVCEQWFDKYADRIEREKKSFSNHFKSGAGKVDLDTKQKWAFVKLNTLMAKGIIDKTEYNDICHHITNGHTFMAFIKQINR